MNEGRVDPSWSADWRMDQLGRRSLEEMRDRTEASRILDNLNRARQAVARANERHNEALLAVHDAIQATGDPTVRSMLIDGIASYNNGYGDREL